MPRIVKTEINYDGVEIRLTALDLRVREALTADPFDRQPVIRLVGALNSYRAAVRRALSSRWGDGAIDELASTIEDIEDEGWDGGRWISLQEVDSE